MGLFAGLKDAKLFERGQYFPCTESHYSVTVVKVIPMMESQKSGSLFTVELQVDESDNPNVKVGEVRTYQQSWKNKTIALSAILEFMVAVFGAKGNEELTAGVRENAEGILELAMADNTDNPMIGRSVKVRTEKTTTKTGGDFTAHRWSPEIPDPE